MLRATASVCVLLSTAASAQEFLLYSASGYPSTSATIGAEPLFSVMELGVGGGFVITALELTTDRACRITRIRAVGGSDDANWSDFNPRIEVFRGGTQGPLQRFASAPTQGDVAQVEGVLAGTPEPFGIGYLGLPHFWVQISIPAVSLQPGNYVVAVYAERAGGSWWWAESRIDRGTAVWAASTLPGTYRRWELTDGYTTGTPAWELYGEYLEPLCGTSDFNGDGDFGTDADIEAFFACLGGSCCGACFAGGADFNGDGDFGTDSDIEAFFRVLAGGAC